MRVIKRVVRLVTDAEANNIMGRNVHENRSSECGHTSMISALDQFTLTSFEIHNIVNIKPKGLACLQTIVEEMVERLDSEQMQKLLEIVQQ
ncbi:hypothetical protein PAEPH01_0408 [Pancytospora epiphaga]|nr:hypothetical protein PAEPH01_0408 [Pancytospora epiphaga]